MVSLWEVLGKFWESSGKKSTPMSPTAKLIYHFDPFSLDTGERILLRNGRHIPLMPKTFELLKALVERSGNIVGKEELMQRVWPDVFVEEVNLFKNISDLRKVLSGGDSAEQYIETIPKRGYCFIARVRQSWEELGDSIQTGATSADIEVDVASGMAHQGEWVGHEWELARLHSYLNNSLQGEGRVVFVTGELGVGKTSLVKAFLQSVAADRRVLIAYGRCLAHYDACEAYLSVLEALHGLCRGPGRERLITLLAQLAPTWLALMPSLIRIDERQALQREILSATRQRMLREMTETIKALTADIPLVLVIEDLHWSDYSTIDLISALAQRREPSNFLLIGTWRPVEVNLSGHPLKAVKQELQMRRCCEELTLGFLTETE